MSARIIPFIRPQRPALRPASAQQRLAATAATAATIINPKEQVTMQIARRIITTAAVTMAAERAIRVRVATNASDIDLAISPKQAAVLRRDLGTLLDRLQREATPPAGSGS